MPNGVPEYNQFVEYVTEGYVIHPVLLLQQSFDALPTLEALAEGYQHVAALGRAVDLAPVEVDAVKIVVADAYQQDVADNEVGVSPAQTVNRLIWVRGHSVWTTGISVLAGRVYLHAGTLWRCVQGHTTQSDWMPGAVGSEALWTRYYPDGTVQNWVQPLADFDAYPLGKQVMHGGHTWESLVPDNVWEPGAPGVTQWKNRDAPTHGQGEDWIQPVPGVPGKEPYDTGDTVTFGWQLWNCIVDNNVWQPGVFGWTLVP